MLHIMAGHPYCQHLSDEYGRGLGLKYPLGIDLEKAMHCSKDSPLEQDAKDPLVYTNDSAGIAEMLQLHSLTQICNRAPIW
jgi:hypothetical protein